MGPVEYISKTPKPMKAVDIESYADFTHLEGDFNDYKKKEQKEWFCTTDKTVN